MVKTLLASFVAAIFMNGCGTATNDNALTIKGGTSSLLSTQAVSGINPTTVKVKIRKIALSKNEDCSTLVTVFETSNPDYIDFATGPTLGSGTLTDGTYHCVVIEMSDLVKFTPAESSTNNICKAMTEVTMDVCADRGDGDTAYQLIDGTTGACETVNTEDYVGVWISTLSTAVPVQPGQSPQGNPFVPPAANSAQNGFKLQGAFTKSGGKTGTFIIDFNGRISEQSGQCNMESPNWGFQ